MLETTAKDDAISPAPLKFRLIKFKVVTLDEILFFASQTFKRKVQMIVTDALKKKILLKKLKNVFSHGVSPFIRKL